MLVSQCLRRARFKARRDSRFLLPPAATAAATPIQLIKHELQIVRRHLSKLHVS